MARYSVRIDGDNNLVIQADLPDDDPLAPLKECLEHGTVLTLKDALGGKTALVRGSGIRILEVDPLPTLPDTKAMH